jgi:hypothetical protein
MTLRIQTSAVNDKEDLRTLLLDAVSELTGGQGEILEPKLAWDGHPMLLADAQQHPVVVSFDPVQAQAALLNGLQAAERLSAALPWVNQVYDTLQKKQNPPRLVVISQDPPPGAAAILACCPRLQLYQYKVLTVNGEAGLWLERVEDSPTSAPAPKPEIMQPTLVASRPSTDDTLPTLSDEESAYFQQL